MEDVRVKLGKMVHTGIGVNNIEDAVPFYAKLFGKKIGKDTVDHRGVKMKEGEIFEVRSKDIGLVKVAVLSVGDKTFEFLQPVDWPWLSNIINQKGEGIYHVAYAVEDLEIALEQFNEMGVKLSKDSIKNDEIAFVEPTEGVIIELIDIKKEKQRTGGTKMSYH